MTGAVHHPDEHTAEHQAWDDVGARPAPSWYLHPLVAAQKRDVHLRLIAKATQGRPAPRRVLKTDLFEEAFGDDQILGDFPAPAGVLYGVDTAASTTRRAAVRFPRLAGTLAVADLRSLPLGAASFDLIISPSSLDHFESDAELDDALAELGRLLAPGGRILLTFDNPWNPLYHVLRAMARIGLVPFPLGRTPAPAQVPALLRRHGFEPLGEDWVIHNPRGLSTVLFLTLQRILGPHAGGAIAALLRLFARLERLPVRRWTACFYAVWAKKADSADGAGL